MSFVFKKELDTTELIKWGMASFGAVIAFVALQYVNFQIEVAKIKKEALQEIIEYSPRARINYTNQLSDDGKVLTIRVYLVAKTKGELYIFPPTLSIFDEEGNEIPNDMYKADDIGQFQGSFSPNEPYLISYKIEFSDDAFMMKPSTVCLQYRVETANIDSYPLFWFSKELEKLHVIGGSEASNGYTMPSLTSKTLKYSEKIYADGDNPIWGDFWEKPR